MLGRAEVVDVLVREGMSETSAWYIALHMAPEYLDILDEPLLQDDVENIVAEYRNGRVA